MKKRIAFRKLGRTTAHKWAMLRNMVTSLVYHERIETTVAKAKELKFVAEKVIRYAKSGTRYDKQQANRILRERPAMTKLFEILGPRYRDRDGGYTRVLKLSKRRVGDNAPLAIIEYVDREGEVRPARPPPSRLSHVLASVGIKGTNSLITEPNSKEA